ncbi:Transposon Ty3-G Gag-Pol polyprotein-like protein [Drosera capensis]
MAKESPAIAPMPKEYDISLLTKPCFYTLTLHEIHPNPDGLGLCNVGPYRYPTMQKIVIEQLVNEMLESGVKRPSCSPPLSSPVVLLRVKDACWRICVDYIELNKSTVKNKYPIFVIEELLDKLHGSQVYSKKNLRSYQCSLDLSKFDE